MPLKKTCQLIIAEAKRRGWKTRVVNSENGLIAFTVPGKKEQTIRSSSHPSTTAISEHIACNKDVFLEVVSDAGLGESDSILSDSWEDAAELLKSCESIVVKPSDGAHGNGVTVGIKNEDAFDAAVNSAKEFSNTLITQRQHFGNDYRVLVIGDEAVAVTHRRPAHVVGNGENTISELIDIENTTNNDRAPDYQKTLCTINKSAAIDYLDELSETIPVPGEEVTVMNVPNIGQGGTSINVTDEASDYIKDLAVEAAKLIGVRLAGVDFITSDISEDDPDKIALIEINATPSFGLHEEPGVGESVPVSAMFLDEITS